MYWIFSFISIHFFLSDCFRDDIALTFHILPTINTVPLDIKCRNLATIYVYSPHPFISIYCTYYYYILYMSSN